MSPSLVNEPVEGSIRLLHDSTRYDCPLSRSFTQGMNTHSDNFCAGYSDGYQVATHREARGTQPASVRPMPYGAVYLLGMTDNIDDRALPDNDP